MPTRLTDKQLQRITEAVLAEAARDVVLADRRTENDGACIKWNVRFADDNNPTGHEIEQRTIYAGDRGAVTRWLVTGASEGNFDSLEDAKAFVVREANAVLRATDSKVAAAMPAAQAKAPAERKPRGGWNPQYIRHMMAQDDQWLARGLVRIFTYQTSIESASERTIERNDVGFSGVDSEFLTSVAKKLIQYAKKVQVNGAERRIYSFASDKQRDAVRKCMLKYSGQLARIADGKQ